MQGNFPICGIVILLRGAERVWPTRNEAQPNGEGVASGSATRVLKKNCSINIKKFKKLRVFTPKPLRTKSTLHHWTCGAFGMRGRCRPPPSLTSQGLRPRNINLFNLHQLFCRAQQLNPLLYQRISTCQPHFD